MDSKYLISKPNRFMQLSSFEYMDLIVIEMFTDNVSLVIMANAIITNSSTDWYISLAFYLEFII